MVVALSFISTLGACGPRQLSAFGNPGDYCTESSSCVDGTTCRPTDDGYRCVGGAGSESSTPPSQQGSLSDDEESESRPAEQDESIDSAERVEVAEDVQEQVMDFDDAADESDEYLPPSRRRRGR